MGRRSERQIMASRNGRGESIRLVKMRVISIVIAHDCELSPSTLTEQSEFINPFARPSPINNPRGDWQRMKGGCDTILSVERSYAIGVIRIYHLPKFRNRLVAVLGDRIGDRQEVRANIVDCVVTK